MVLLPLLLLAVATSTSNLTLLAPEGDIAETAMAMSGNRIVLAAMAHTAPAPIKIFVSTDSGMSWVQAPDLELSIGGKTYAYAGDPTIVTLDDGSFGLAYLVNSATYEHPSGEIALVYQRSADGVTWSAPLVVDSGPSQRALAVDKPTISVDRIRGNVYLVWTRTLFFATWGNVVASSADRGATWSAPRIVGSNTEGYAQLAATADGTLVLTSADPNNQVYFSRFSTDGGASFSDPRVMASGASFFSIPSAKASSSPVQMIAAFHGDVYCAYPTPAGVFFTRSRDGGKTWSDPLHLGGATGRAFMPTIAVDDASGNIAVAWLDSRDDASGATFRLYAAQSVDGGASFDTALPFSPPFAGGTVMGDYNGSVVIGNGVALTTYSPAGGHLTAARLFFATPPARRRAVRPSQRSPARAGI